MTIPSPFVSELNSRPLAGPAWLDLKHPIYDIHHEDWERNERLFKAGSSMRAEELVMWETETATGGHYKLRLNTAPYINLPKKHAQMMTGHLRRKAPKAGKGYDFGALGEVRSRADYSIATASLAELLWYNCDGVGSDGSQFDVYMDTVSDWAQCTGFRWLMLEMPTFTPEVEGQTPSYQNVISGLRPYLVHLSPLNVPLWWDLQGQLEFAVVRIPTDAPDFAGDTIAIVPPPDLLGYYLVVKKGCKMLGAEFEAGGWWLWDSRKEFIANAPWSHAGGEIPLFPMISIPDQGTIAEPNIGASQTEELGQIAVGIMNVISARDSDAMDAAESKIYVLGADHETMDVIQKTSKGQIVAVPAVARQQSGADGGVTYQIPTLYDGSAGAVPADVFTTILTSKWEEARQIMIDQVTSTPNSSGKSKEAGFVEASSPLLARMATTREQAENTVLYFYALRCGVNADASVEWPKEFDLAPVVEDIDAMLDTMRRAAQTQTVSPTMNMELLMMALENYNFNFPPALVAKMRKEIEAAQQQQQQQKDAQHAATISALNGTTPGGGAPSAGGGSAGAGAAGGAPKPRALGLSPAASPGSEGFT